VSLQLFVAGDRPSLSNFKALGHSQRRASEARPSQRRGFYRVPTGIPLGIRTEL
jgi:hypothetical protein